MAKVRASDIQGKTLTGESLEGWTGRKWMCRTRGTRRLKLGASPTAMIFTIPVVVERTLVVGPTHKSFRLLISSSHIGGSNGEINGGGLLFMAKYKAQEMSKGIYQGKLISSG
ncbi:unnamed protein product [Ilex paraguariensis]|uniref:Uncharacterized protein n=1 Tax=Ilex paraguariensis TaxID=185542 RepID=A0ABC8TLA5_9AQUA